MRHVLAAPTGFTILHVNPIFEMVTHGLGFDHRDVLDLAYPSATASIA